MKVDNDVKPSFLDPLTRLKNVKSSQGTGTEGVKGPDTTDKVELTAKKDEINRIKEKIKSMPEVRQEKVETIRKALEEGTYTIRGELVAQRLLKDHFLDQIL